MSELRLLRRAALLLFCLTACARTEQGPHVVVISLDTTRADHLGSYGAQPNLTPHIDAFASEATVFADVTAPAPTTLSSHTSMMTGRYPLSHGVVRNGFRVHEDNVMLAEVLKQAGFHTAGFLGSFALDSLFGFAQGFDYYDDRDFDVEISAQGHDQRQRRAERVTDAVLEHVDEVKGERLFLFAHYFDAHQPFDPERAFQDRFLPEERRGKARGGQKEVGRSVKDHQARALNVPHKEAPGVDQVIVNGLRPELVRTVTDEPTPLDEDLAALYKAEINYMDGQIGRLLDGLRERGILDDAIVIVTGDHGETFWEHGDYWNHGLWVYQTTLAIPLIVRLPGAQSAGGRVETPVSTVDLLPTVCELLELEVPAGIDGRSLALALRGTPLEDRIVFSQATQPGRPVEPVDDWANLFKPRCVRTGPWKYVQAPYLKIEQMFNLEKDPFEKNDLLAKPRRSARMEERLQELRALMNQRIEGRSPLPSEFNPEQIQGVMEALQALGYASGEEDEDADGETGERDG